MSTVAVPAQTVTLPDIAAVGDADTVTFFVIESLPQGFTITILTGKVPFAGKTIPLGFLIVDVATVAPVNVHS